MIWKGLIACVFCTILGFVVADKIRYDNYRVYTIKFENENQLAKVNNLSISYDFWQHPTTVSNNADIVVPPNQLKEFTDFVKKNGLNTNLMVENIQKLIDNEKPTNRTRAGFGWTDYYELDEMYAWMKSIAERYPGVASIVKGGDTFLRRQILGIKIEFDKNFKSVAIESNIHAREWITSATATWLINEILTREDKGVLGEYNWYIFPVTNPDGLVYTHKTDRMWRKTRSKVESEKCHGVDANRNWGYQFLVNGGASTNPCSVMYAGPAAFSEIETRTLSEYLAKIPNLELYLSFHSFLQRLMIPYAYTTERLDNYDELIEISRKAVEALKQRYGTVYKIGSFAEAIYIGSGVSVDWVKGVLRVPYAFTYEFRDRGKFGFLLPADQIIPNSEEVLDSLLVILNEIKKN